MKTNEWYAKLKTNIVGYLTLLLFIVVVVKTFLFKFLIFLLLIYLVTDLFVTTIRKRFPGISRNMLLYYFYVLLIAFCLVVILRVIPKFVADLPAYANLIEQQFTIFINQTADKYSLDFDYAAAKQKIFEEGTDTLKQFFNVFKGVSKGLVLFLIALVLNFFLFREQDLIRETFTAKPETLMSYLYYFISKHIAIFYLYFQKVMGGQIIISFINTLITLVIVFFLDLPHKITLVCLIFVCGLIPVVGNIVSNTILSVTALISVGIPAAIICLVFLIAIHKLEYFLNSKIIGAIVKLPFAITLFALLLGEALLGIGGMIIAIPLVLSFKREMEGFSIDQPVE